LAVSHDRSFLEHFATRVFELNRAYARGLLEAAGSYSDFLLMRDEILANQAEYQATLANKAGARSNGCVKEPRLARPKARPALPRRVA